jgi:alcohol dehydrogenase
MPSFDFHPSSRIIFGENTLERIGNLAKELGGHRVLLVTDSGILRTGYVNRALHALQKEFIEVFVFSDVAENPTTRHVENGVRFAEAKAPIDLIVALGGGSAMDGAKGINFLLTNGGKMEDYWGVDKAAKPMLPSIGVPTTAGTGSEAQSFALISQEQTHIKMACGDKKARFRAVILDPILLQTVPPRVAAVTGIDAISHALESFVCTKRNPISQMFAKEAWRLLEKNFNLILKEPENIAAQSAMLLGAHFAGMAIENSMLGAAHACANPLTAKYNIIHGVAVGLMLPHVIRLNSLTVNACYADLLEAVKISASPSIGAGERLRERITELKTAAGLPQQLRECGVEKSALPELAQAAANQWTGKFNPRPVAEAEFLQLYETAF